MKYISSHKFNNWRYKAIRLCLMQLLIALCMCMTGCDFDLSSAMDTVASKVYSLFDDEEEDDVRTQSGDKGLAEDDWSIIDGLDADDTGAAFEANELNAASNNTGLDNSRTIGGPIPVYNVDGDLLETEIAVIEEDSKGEASDDEVKAADIVAWDNYDNYYAYSMLDDEHKLIYREIYTILNDLLYEVVMTSKDTDAIDMAFRAVLVDHPEIFYVKGYSLGKYMYDGVLDRITFTGTYTYTKNQVDSKKPEIEQYVTNVLANAPVGDDYNKIKYIYEYLINNNDYVENSKDNQNILSVIENGKTVCQGYAKMTQLLLNRMGIFCTLVNGRASGSNGVGGGGAWGNHVWNVVNCNGRYYNVDTTWGDAAFTLVDNDTGQTPIININYEFLLVDDNGLKDTHKADPVVSMPQCNSLDDNYYVREGCYFTFLDTDRLKNVFVNAYANGNSIVFIKASDREVYNDLMRHIVDEQKIFDYVTQDNVKYVEYPERDLMMISV